FGNVRRVPEDVRPWLVPELSLDEFQEPVTQIWVAAATSALTSVLPDELSAATGKLEFRGPPRLLLPAVDPSNYPLDAATFNTLLKVCTWIFEQPREAEMRHILVGSELARSAPPTEDTSAFLRLHLSRA